ncbi:hypothetical protein K469DRAFT_555193 [Zopfia rhizophila CBS 207.26]|uniref:NWD NACHT-NTPase N-terminal domain-containing protein n=1 Tax=Zopfia rhizophila CBS 207.26 TaxID=1314779 RepID=A0A6A6EKG7_9PEZI|nr:hypothetical protein K469DRAFT_555193 [Zopfia rhizophila CBS 207.26]
MQFHGGERGTPNPGKTLQETNPRSQHINSDRATDCAAELSEGASFTANTETNKKRGLLSEDASQADRCSTKTPRISATGGSNSPTAEITAYIRLRSQLWTEAYDCLEREDARLVDAYERILSLRLHEHAKATAAIGSRDNDMKKMDPEARRQFLKDIIETTFKRSKGGASTKQRLDNSKENLEFVKQMITSITVAGGEVAFAWVGVCLALKFLLKPVTPQGFDREAAAFLISRMNRYWEMSVLLIDENRTRSFTKGSRDYLRKCLIELYTRALSWQMKSICAYYQQQENLFLQDLPLVNDWKEIKDDLQTKEWHISSLTDTSTTWPIVYHLDGLTNTATSDEIKLRDMYLGDVPTVCTACGNLDPRIWGMKSYSTYVMDIQHASLECSACMVIVRGISAIVKPLDGRAQLTLSVRKEASLRVHYHWGVHRVEGARTLEFYIQQGM